MGRSLTVTNHIMPCLEQRQTQHMPATDVSAGYLMKARKSNKNEVHYPLVVNILFSVF